MQRGEWVLVVSLSVDTALPLSPPPHHPAPNGMEETNVDHFRTYGIYGGDEEQQEDDDDDDDEKEEDAE